MRNLPLPTAACYAHPFYVDTSTRVMVKLLKITIRAALQMRNARK
jgi:hypothetical protein